MTKKRIGSSAIAWAMLRVKRGTAIGRNRCLQWVRMCFGIAALYGSARIAWSHVPVHLRHGGHEPPPGVPVFFQVGKYGHVALSVGGGWCISTDILRDGKADRVRIDLITARWNAKYLGWTETLNDVRVYDRVLQTVPKVVPVHADRVLAAAQHDPALPNGVKGLHPTDVIVIEKALVELGLMDDRWVDGTWGTKTSAAWARLQKRLGDKDPSGLPYRQGLEYLAQKTSFVLAA